MSVFLRCPEKFGALHQDAEQIILNNLLVILHIHEVAVCILDGGW